MDALIECSVFSGDETGLTVREKYQRMAAEQGNQAVHDCLAKVDPAGAERLHPNNLKRVIRALEVYEQTGMTIDEFNRRNKRPEPKYDALKIGVCRLTVKFCMTASIAEWILCWKTVCWRRRNGWWNVVC